MGWCISPAALQFSMAPTSSKMTLPCHKNTTWVSLLKKGKIFHVLFTAGGKCIEWRHKYCLHTEASLSQKEWPGLNSPEIAVLSAIVGAGLPLPGQEVFGFEVKHVSVCLSLLALAVHVSLGVLHHVLCLPRHLRNKQKRWREFSSRSLLEQGIYLMHLVNVCAYIVHKYKYCTVF